MRQSDLQVLIISLLVAWTTQIEAIRIFKNTTSEVQSIEDFKGHLRLPKFAIPKHYDLFLKPDLLYLNFTGKVQVTVNIVNDTRFLVLNAVNLSIDGTSIQFGEGNCSKEFHPSEIVLVEEDEILVLRFDEILPNGEGVLSIGFEGTLNDEMKGFYRTSYMQNGELKNMAVTMFEAMDARRCFPCWDEPALKAKFTITLEVPSELMALSNMPIMEEKLQGPKKIVSFYESPIMSTYLVAVVVGLYDYIEDSTTDGTKVRVYCNVGDTDLGKFSLDTAVKMLEIFTRYFNVSYPLPKLDLIHIRDFAPGGMENYGLVTFQKNLLLVDEHQLEVNSRKRRVALTVAHELAHQWFGNLVTMEWWTYITLNEGFATWASYIAADILFPEWEYYSEFLEYKTGFALTSDALGDKHPIEAEINHIRDTDMVNLFDVITYNKGASIIRMLQNYLGAECFKKALSSYIKRYAYSNANFEDLWTVLEEESNKPVKLLMRSWTKQSGYPVVYVQKRDQKLYFEQTQFLSNGSFGDQQWIVPITLSIGSHDAQMKFFLQAKSMELDIKQLMNTSNASKPESFWAKVNVDQTGFYRVKYDDELLDGLRYAIKGNLLPFEDRYGILDDSFALWMACNQTTSSLLSLVASYREENDYYVLSKIIKISDKIVNIIADAAPNLLADVKGLFVKILRDFVEKVGWDPKDKEVQFVIELRQQLLTTLIVFGDDATQNEGVKRFYAFLEDQNTTLLPPNIRKVAYVAIMQPTNPFNKTGYESLLRIYKETNDFREKIRVLNSLASSPNPDIVLDALNFLLTSEVLDLDANHGLEGISSEGRDVSWNFLKEHWDQISKKWTSGVSTSIMSIVPLFSSNNKADEIEEFLADRVKPFGESITLIDNIQVIRNNANLVEYIKSEQVLKDVVMELLNKNY